MVELSPEISTSNSGGESQSTIEPSYCALIIFPQTDNVICPSDLNAILDTLTGEKLSQKSKDELIVHVSIALAIQGAGC